MAHCDSLWIITTQRGLIWFILIHCDSLWLVFAHCGFLCRNLGHSCSFWFIMAHCDELKLLMSYRWSLKSILANCSLLQRIAVYFGLFWSIVCHFSSLWALLGYAGPCYGPLLAAMTHNDSQWLTIFTLWHTMTQNWVNFFANFYFLKFCSKKLFCLKWNSTQSGIQGGCFWLQQLFSAYLFPKTSTSFV